MSHFLRDEIAMQIYASYLYQHGHGHWKEASKFAVKAADALVEELERTKAGNVPSAGVTEK